jgi:hypothetical protein
VLLSHLVADPRGLHVDLQVGRELLLLLARRHGALSWSAPTAACCHTAAVKSPRITIM